LYNFSGLKILSIYKMSKSVVKYKTFEVLCKPESVLKFRGGALSIDKVLISDEIYTNSSKGLKASNQELKNTFNTTNKTEILNIILNKGEYRLTTKELAELTEQKRLAIINYTHTHYIDPVTGKPHPSSRIGEVLKQIKLKVDPYEAPDRQFLKVRQKVNDIIRLKPV